MKGTLGSAQRRGADALRRVAVRRARVALRLEEVPRLGRGPRVDGAALAEQNDVVEHPPDAGARLVDRRPGPTGIVIYVHGETEIGRLDATYGMNWQNQHHSHGDIASHGQLQVVDQFWQWCLDAVFPSIMQDSLNRYTSHLKSDLKDTSNTLGFFGSIFREDWHEIVASTFFANFYF